VKRIAVIFLTAVACGALSRCGAMAQQPEGLSATRRAEHLASFDQVWRTVLDRHWDPALNGADWEGARRDLRPRVEAAAPDKEARAAMTDLIDRLGQTHFNVVPGVDGKPAWKVLVTPRRGSAQTYFFDQASSLVVKLQMIVRTPAGEVPVDTYLADYREADGIRMPHRLRQVAAGQELVTTLESVTHNTEIPAGQFDLPKEIQALVAKK